VADVAQLSRALNAVRSVGQSRAALAAALDQVARGNDLAEQLSVFSTPDPDEARTTMAIDAGQVTAELRLLEGREDTSPVDPTEWARQRRAIERVFVDVSGIEGVTGALAQISFAQILADAIAAAPGLIAEYAGKAAAAVAPAAFGLGTLLVLALLVLVAVRARAGA
jgi:hypothetical protein